MARALRLEAQAGAAQIDFVTGAEALTAAVAGGNFDRAAVAENAGAEFAAVVGQAILAVFAADVGVLARNRAVGLVSVLFENYIVGRTTRCSLSVSSLKRPMLVQGLSRTYSSQAALPFTTTRRPMGVSAAALAGSRW